MRRRAIPSLLVLAVVSSVTPRASAAPPPADAAAAEALFQEGRRLLEAGSAAEACPKLEESQRLDPGMGTLFHLGSCYEAVGRTASAWASFREVESAAKAAGRRDREALARQRAEALEPKLVRLRVEVPWASRARDVEVRRGAAIVGPGQWGTAVPVDPGPVVVRATAAGKRAVEVRVTVDQPGTTKVVVVPEPADAGGPSAPAPAPSSGSPIRTAGWIGVGVGAAGVAASGVIGLLAKSKYDDSTASCSPSGDCTDPRDVAGRHDARSQANVATIVFVGAAVVAVAGVVMVLVAPKSARAGVVSPLDLGLGGRF